MYTTRNFKTKKALKEAVAAWMAGTGRPVTYYRPNADVTGHEAPRNGSFCCEGPHYPEPHRWYAACESIDGNIVKVR